MKAKHSHLLVLHQNKNTRGAPGNSAKKRTLTIATSVGADVHTRRDLINH